MELEVTWGRAVRIWWAYVWRNLIAIVASLIINFIIGFIIGFILAIAGAPRGVGFYVALPLGFAIGLAISVVPLKMILGKDFGEFRLVLMAKTPMKDAPVDAPSPSVDPTSNIYVRPDGG